MATYTEHYGLHQWEATDDFLRTDFNTDHQLIDAALGEIESLAEGKIEIVTGRYQGDDLGSRVIELGFQPKAVLLMQQTGMTATFESVSGGLAMSGAPVLSWGDEPVVELVSNGFRVVRGNNIYTNHSSYTFHYMAFR